MKIHRFFIQGDIPQRGRFVLSDEAVIHQLRHVLRFKTGHELILLNNSGLEFRAEITRLTNDDAVFEILSCEKSVRMPKRNVTLYMALSKRDSFEMILEKGTELGVAAIVPVLSERSEKKSLNMERAQKIIREAAEQSERATLPEIHEIKTLAEILEEKPAGIFALDPRGQHFNIEKIGGDKAGEIRVLIGPEGGWSEKEIALMKERNIPVYSLGSQILRAETAAIAFASICLIV